MRVYLVCRGEDSSGIGGTFGTTYYSPVLSGAGLLYSDFAIGSKHQCGLLYGTDRMRCWGDGSAGAIGDGTTVSRSTPVPLDGAAATKSWISFDCGNFMTAAIDSTGTLYTWGKDTNGELAQAVSAGTIQEFPTVVSGTYPAFVQVAAGKRTICARTTDNRMFCAGDGSVGQTGTGAGPSPLPWTSYNVLTEVNPSMTSWRWGPILFHDTVAAGKQATYPLDLFSWGLNDVGQGGSGSPGTNLQAPVAVMAPPTNFKAYAIGSSHACGIDNTGDVYCIGNNDFGRYSQITPSPAICNSPTR
jgi:alpha-tubulin suppressor-like RCC1 family protein